MIDVFLAAPTAPDTLRRAFLDAVARPTSINEHLTVMRDTASGLNHITEFGVGECNSTLAWLLVQPEKLCLYDAGYQACLPRMIEMRGRTKVQFIQADTRYVDIEATDLLFIDTAHTYDQLTLELTNADRARRYLVFHDVEIYGESGEDRKRPGLWRAIEDLMVRDPSWHVIHRASHNHGLAVLERVR